jgi:hypothetical protein
MRSVRKTNDHGWNYATAPEQFGGQGNIAWTYTDAGYLMGLSQFTILGNFSVGHVGLQSRMIDGGCNVLSGPSGHWGVPFVWKHLAWLM